GCESLTKVKIPENVETIGTKAFYNAKKLRTVTIKSTELEHVGKNALKGIHKKAVIKVPKSRKKFYQKLFRKKGQAVTVKIKSY
nr:leucine-rich repeat domain-containing protein [Lachnospiraceae bacterium]